MDRPVPLTSRLRNKAVVETMVLGMLPWQHAVVRGSILDHKLATPMCQLYAKKKLLFTCGAFVAMVGLCPAQLAPSIEWQHTFGGSADEDVMSVAPTSDGGTIMAGRSMSNNGDLAGNHGLDDAWIIKTDGNGMLQWQHLFGGSGIDNANCIRQTTDGGYIFTGNTSSHDGDVIGNHGGLDCWVVKVSPTGTMEWQEALGGTSDDAGQSILQTSDGGYIVAGSTRSNDGNVSGHHGGSDGWVVKLDSQGTLEWQTCLGNSEFQALSGIAETYDGGYIATGTATGSSSWDLWVVKLDDTGLLQWEQMLGGDMDDIGTMAQQTADNGYIICGSTLSNTGEFACNHGGFDGFVIKLDPNGGMEWQRTCIGGSADDVLNAVAQTTDGGYVLAGWTESTDGDVSGNHGLIDGWLIRMDDTGTILWEKTLGGTGNDGMSAVLLTNEGGYIVAGNSSSSDGDVSENKGGFDAWQVKLDPDHVGIASMDTRQVFRLYPNPVHDVLKIRMEANSPEFDHWRVLALDGRNTAWLASTHPPSSEQELRISVDQLPPGTYALQLRSGSRTWTERFVKQ